MARVARIVVPGYPHHITQRGNRRQPTFFRAEDYRAYLHLMAEWCGRHGVEVWAYCLMPNHVHLIAVPETEDGFRRAIGEAHRRYTLRINAREGWRGYLWQGRFGSFVMEQTYLLTAARYVELNPLRAGLEKAPGEWPWSSAGAHLRGKDDALVKTRPLLEIVGEPWQEFLAISPEEETLRLLRRLARTGRPLGSARFVGELERHLGRPLIPQKRGRKPRERN